MKTTSKMKQALGIFSLVFALDDDERRPAYTAFAKRAGVDAKLRNQLVKAGLLETKKEGRVTRVELTDRGWVWAAENLRSSLPDSRHASQVLAGILARLGPFLERRGESLAEFAADLGSGAKPTPLADRLRAAGLAIAGGTGRRIRLSEIRRALPDVSREELDRLLLELQRQERLVLYRIDDPTDIHPDDEQAALTINGNARHILYLEP